MSVTIREINSGFGGEVSGVDLRQRLTPDEAAAIEAGMNEYAVLVFRDQDITDEQQIAFSKNFGEIEKAIGGNITKDAQRRLTVDMADVSNLDQTHKPLPPDDRRRLFNLGNMLWHSDSSFRVVPAKFSILSARSIPSKGGDTEFADMRAAYDALDAETKTEIEDLVCEHSLLYSRGLLGFSEFTPEERQTFTPVRQRLVRTHPATARKSLFLASHAGTIVGWEMAHARILLRDLIEHATQPRFVYAHRWRRHDLVMWDNRATMHRGRRYDEREKRDMRRTTLQGDGPTVEQARAA